MLDLENYEGREQAYVKHYFLGNYLEALVHKTASSFNHIVYVDGFSGPWQSSGENYADTSFGIALGALRKAKATWKKLGREVMMTAHLVEKSSQAYKNLLEVPSRFPDLTVRPYNNDFVSAVPDILASIPKNAFVFLFIDPKGWRIPIEKLEKLLSRENTEVVFNFMFEFINRAASMTDPITVNGLDELITRGSWRERLAEIQGVLPKYVPKMRKEVLIDAFSKTVSSVGSYKYVVETPILRPLKDRTLYSLIYATRKPAGLEVFRDCQAKTLRQQDSVRGAKKLENLSTQSNQAELFGSFHEMAPDESATYFQENARGAELAFLQSIPDAPAMIVYGDLWPEILAKYAIRRTELNALASRLWKDGIILIPQMSGRKRVPDDSYQLSKPSSPA